MMQATTTHTNTAQRTNRAAALISVDSGNNQFGAVNQKLVLPLVAVVTDTGYNRLPGIPVTFMSKQGFGTFNGASTWDTVTDSDGRALASLTLGSQPGQDNQVVEAIVSGSDTGFPAAFIASAKVPGDPAATRISGVVLDNSNQPIPGVTMRLYQANLGLRNNVHIEVATAVVTDAHGYFNLASVPVGLYKLMADGNTATVPNQTYPTLEYDVVTVSGQDNGVGMPIYLPALDPNAKLCVNETTGGTLTLASSPGFSLTLQPGAATFPGGAKTGCVTVTPVNPDKVPMTPGFGQQPRYVVTIQPVGTTFNPPAAITIPNMDGLAPRAKTEMYSYDHDHDLAAFVAIGSATVSQDGSVIASDPGIGVMKAGWHCGGNPNTAGSVGTCPDCLKCEGTECVADAGQFKKTPCNKDACMQCNQNGGCEPVQVTVTITAPPDNPAPSDATFATNFSFLAQRSFANIPDGDVVAAQATLSPSGDASEITWTITGGEIRAENPASRKGATFSFVPNPGAHLAYVRGSDGCATGILGNGSCGRSTALSYQIKANFCSKEDMNTIAQDQLDIIRQEYVNHGISVPARSDFTFPAATTNFKVAEITTTAYSVVLGAPGELAQRVRDAYNRLIYDDIQAVPIGTSGLTPTSVVVRPGAVIDPIGEILDTSPCSGAPNPATCDDQISGNTVVAGINGIAETIAKNEITNFSLRLNSAWRNPQRNEAAGGVLTSRHQEGNAVDLDITAEVGGKTLPQLFCILQTAARSLAGTNGFTENLSTQVLCNVSEVTHVHVQQP